MIYIGLDQSLLNTGIAIIEFDVCQEPKKIIIHHIKIETLTTKHIKDCNQKLIYILNSLDSILNLIPNHVSYEGVFKSLNVNTLIKLAKVQGCVETLIGKYDLAHSIVTPKEWQVEFELNKIKDKEKSVEYVNTHPELVNNITSGVLNNHTADAILISLFSINRLLKD